MERFGRKMATNNVKTSVKIPQFNRENIHIYINELKMWQFVTEVEKKKQGPLVWMSLPLNDSSNIKQAINDIIGMDDLSKDDGMDKVLELLKKTFQQEKELEAFSKWKQFDRVRRIEGEDVRSFVNRFNTAYSAIAKMEITIPVSTRAIILVQKAMISEELERMVIHKVEFEQDGCFEEVTKSLVRMMGDSTKVLKEDNDESYVAEKVEKRLTEVMAAYKWKK